jgi:hypothetical protein
MMIQKALRVIVCYLLVFSVFGTLAAAHGQVIVSANVGECTLTIETIDQGQALRMRALHPQGRYCEIDRGSVVSILIAAFSQAAAPKLAGSYSSLSIGRLIDYPWLSHYLASAASHDQGWDARKGRPVAVDINRYVAQMLSRSEALTQIEQGCARGGYRIVAVSVEKVLVGGLREVPRYQGVMEPGLFPYDAIVWYRLKKD